MDYVAHGDHEGSVASHETGWPCVRVGDAKNLTLDGHGNGKLWLGM